MNNAGVRQRVDGRTMRAERTRQAITDAHLALLEEGDLRPTAERIAERAGVSLRALWTNFKDMEGLFAAAGERLMQRQRAEFRPIPPELPLPERIERYCAQRARMLELIAPAARAARIREPFSAQLRKSRAWYLQVARDEIETLFALELATAGPVRGEVLDALMAAATFAGWSMWRDDLHLDVPAATAVFRRVVSALLPASAAA
ncbi:TetR family transcriptional regulator [Dactylosporangium sp. NPDC000555]|uniref:TetR/AcrR family transcriptional regulator n=1 Tax=Dactylosporangium sp. NPDC000555 TaxID=3154260 RepID=UPI0033272E43